MKEIYGIKLTDEMRDKLIALEENTSSIWNMPISDPDYQHLHDLCKRLQEDLFLLGLSPSDINLLTYGEDGVLYG